MQRGQAMTNELKPCPFCEGTGRLESEDQCGGFGCYTTIVCVKCQNCGATGARSDEYFHGRNESHLKQLAIDNWNRRTTNEKAD